MFQVTMSNDFFDNVITMFRHFRRNLYELAKSPVDSEIYTWNLIAFPFTVNAFHLQQLNSIGNAIKYKNVARLINFKKLNFWITAVIPNGLLTDPLFSLRIPKYLNVGSMGLTLAHEIWHSLDNTGRDFDGMGILKHTIFDQDSQKSYDNISSCFVNQYREHFKRPLQIDTRDILIEV
jgi:predicted metalloendopeptidase